MAYQNPKPNIGGKRFILRVVVDFDDWIVKPEAAKAILDLLYQNPREVEKHLADITPIEEYYK